MNKEEIIEGNELIVSFLGWTKFSHNQRYNLTGCRDYDCYNIGEFSKYSDIYIPECGDLPAAHYNLEFHSSWDWLMPVVRKIVEYCINENENAFLSDEYTAILETIPLAIIKDSWKVVIEFIKWYNTQNNG